MAGLKDTIATLARMRPSAPMVFSLGDTGVLETVGAFGKNSGNLVMKTYSPPGLGRDRPLVVVLHGCTQTAESYAVEAGWVDLAARYGFALLCPEQVAANNPNRCFNWFNPTDIDRGAGEVASIAAMIETAISRASSDRSQVYVTGLSAGGAMAAAMLATYPELFAGGGIIAGLPYGVAKDMPSAFAAMQGMANAPPSDLHSASRHKGPWPRVSVWHGTADATVRVSNADASVHQWLAINGLAGDADEIVVDGQDRQDRWTKNGVVVVERRLISGLGHGTPISASGPDGAGRAGPFVLDVGIASSAELLRFWGITPAQRQPASSHAKVSQGKPSVHERETVRHYQPTAFRGAPKEQGISAIINNALRSAGLMK